MPAEVPSKKTSVPEGTLVTLITASNAAVAALKVGLKRVFVETAVASELT